MSVLWLLLATVRASNRQLQFIDTKTVVLTTKVIVISLLQITAGVAVSLSVICSQEFHYSFVY